VSQPRVAQVWVRFRNSGPEAVPQPVTVVSRVFAVLSVHCQPKSRALRSICNILIQSTFYQRQSLVSQHFASSLHCPRSGSGPPEPGPTQVRTSQVRSRSSLQVDRTAFAGPGPGEERTANRVRTARTLPGRRPSQPNVFSVLYRKEGRVTKLYTSCTQTCQQWLVVNGYYRL